MPDAGETPAYEPDGETFEETCARRGVEVATTTEGPTVVFVGPAGAEWDRAAHRAAGRDGIGLRGRERRGT